MNRNSSASAKRVLQIVGCMDRAGAETMVMNLYRQVDRKKFQFDFVYFTADRCDYDDEIEALGGRIYRITGRGVVSRFRALYQLLRNGMWEAVHSHTNFSSAFHLAAARLAGVSLRVAHSHATHDASSEAFVGRIYHAAARRIMGWSGTTFVACGVAAAEYLFPNRRDVVVIPNAVDIQGFSGASGEHVRMELGLLPGQLIIIQVARFTPVKNHERSIDIGGVLKNLGAEFQLLLAGTGPEQGRIEQLVRERGLESHVRLLGLRADISELMAAADVMLMPSFHEGFPVVLVEAQAAGLPSVVSNTISPEVDLGMGAVQFVDLSATDHEWVRALRDAAVATLPDDQARQAVLEQGGFSSAAGARRLEAIYESAIRR